MLKGRVEWWSKEGYGYIRLDDDKSIFAHIKNTDNHQTIKENTLIEFTLEKENSTYILCLHTPQEN